MRCSWVNENCALYVKYHDEEWGVPVYEDKKLFEMLLLESFQAGLSWLTVLRKREAFRAAFDKFDVRKIAGYDGKKIEQLLQNKEIIRSRLKILAAVGNARVFLKIQEEYRSFSKYLWHFTKGQVQRYNVFPCAVRNALSDEISADLRRRGMKYVGSVIVYSYLQAVGVINDHEPECCCYKKR